MCHVGSGRSSSSAGGDSGSSGSATGSGGAAGPIDSTSDSTTGSTTGGTPGTSTDSDGNPPDSTSGRTSDSTGGTSGSASTGGASDGGTGGLSDAELEAYVASTYKQTNPRRLDQVAAAWTGLRGFGARGSEGGCETRLQTPSAERICRSNKR